MALQTSLITFTGRLGNMIGYCSNGKYLLRSAPASVRQTLATRRAARCFGMASRKAALIRKAFYPRLDMRCDGTHVNRLNRTVILAGRNNTEGLTGFRFNKHAGTDKFFAVAPQLSRDNVLHIPAQVLPPFKGITALEIKVVATRIDFSMHRVIGTTAAMLVLDLREPFAGAAIDVDIPGKGTLLVTMQVRGKRQQEYAAGAGLLAADIVAVSAPQVPLHVGKPHHPHPYLIRQKQRARTAIAAPGPDHPLALRE